MVPNLVWSFGLLIAGVLTGLFFMGTVVLEPAVEQLPPEAHILFRQQMIPRLHRLAPPLMVSVLLCSIFVTVWGCKGISQVLEGTSSALSVFILLTTILGNVPLNQQFSAWKATHLPLNWQDLVARWAFLDRVRCGAALVMFALQLSALFLGRLV